MLKIEYPGNWFRKQSYRLARLTYADPFKWMALPLHEFFAWIESINEVEEEDKAARNDK